MDVDGLPQAAVGGREVIVVVVVLVVAVGLVVDNTPGSAVVGFPRRVVSGAIGLVCVVMRDLRVLVSFGVSDRNLSRWASCSSLRGL